MKATRLALVCCLAPGAALAGSAGGDSWKEALRRPPPGNAWPSKGCQSQDTLVPATKPFAGWMSIEVPDFQPVKRRFWASLPMSVGALGAQPAPLLLSFHGQSGTADDDADWHTLKDLAPDLDFLLVHLQGIDDFDEEHGAPDLGTGWNTGSAGDNSTCVAKEMEANTTGCYKSCRQRGLCGACNWSGCWDEPLFVRQVIKRIGEMRCVDLSRLYIQGESNGAMLVHHLTHRMPGTFAAAVPWFGHPLTGYLLGRDFELFRRRDEARKTAMLQLHGRSDTTIPPNGGLSDGGWLYETLEVVQGVWAAVHDCEKLAVNVSTPFDGGPENLACSEYLACRCGRRVMRCYYDGEHGTVMEGGRQDNITVWFALQFRLPAPHDVSGHDGSAVPIFLS